MNRGLLCFSVLAFAGAAVPVWAVDGTRTGSIGVHDFEMKSIDGEAVKLSKYRGNVLMIINVASK